MGTESGAEVKEQLMRLLNAIASFQGGRSYLLNVGGGKELLVQVITALKAKRLHGHAFENAVALLQKLSIRLVVKSILILFCPV